jgi:hypothetical protein
MEVYVLDSLLRRIQVFDKFESLIWTERFSEIGDFELDLKSTLENRSAFTNDTRIAINESYRVMTVESVEDSTDSEGKSILKVKGKSLEAILDDRVATDSTVDLTPWELMGTPGDIARTMFNDICVLGTVNPRDVIPFIAAGTIFPPNTIPESSTEIVWSQSPDSLKNAIKAICDLYDLGFRLIRNFDTSQLYFDIYSGDDRTSRQTLLSPVIFAANLDNLQNTTEYKSTEGSKNVAYVFSEAGFQIVYGDNVDPNVDGFERRVLGVNASDITVDNPDPVGALIQRGTEELAKNRGLQLFDGEINQYSEYTYGVDYNLGDIVEMRNKDGIITYQRITEQIFVSDQEGERSYPTLAIDLFAGTDTWLSWNNKNTAWNDYDLSMDAWADM